MFLFITVWLNIQQNVKSDFLVKNIARDQQMLSHFTGKTKLPNIHYKNCGFPHICFARAYCVYLAYYAMLHCVKYKFSKQVPCISHFISSENDMSSTVKIRSSASVKI